MEEKTQMSLSLAYTDFHSFQTFKKKNYEPVVAYI